MKKYNVTIWCIGSCPCVILCDCEIDIKLEQKYNTKQTNTTIASIFDL